MPPPELPDPPLPLAGAEPMSLGPVKRKSPHSATEFTQHNISTQANTTMHATQPGHIEQGQSVIMHVPQVERTATFTGAGSAQKLRKETSRLHSFTSAVAYWKP